MTATWEKATAGSNPAYPTLWDAQNDTNNVSSYGITLLQLGNDGTTNPNYGSPANNAGHPATVSLANLTLQPYTDGAGHTASSISFNAVAASSTVLDIAAAGVTLQNTGSSVISFSNSSSYAGVTCIQVDAASGTINDISVANGATAGIGISLNSTAAIVESSSIQAATAIQVSSGASATIQSNNISNSATALLVASGASTVTLGSSGTGNTFDGTNVSYIQNQSSQTISAIDETFGSVGPADTTLSDLYAVQNKVIDGISSGSGLVRIRSGSVYVTPTSETNSGAIGRAESLAPSDTIHVEGAVTFTADVSSISVTYGDPTLTNLTGTVATTYAYALPSNSEANITISGGPTAVAPIASGSYNTSSTGGTPLDTHTLSVRGYTLNYAYSDPGYNVVFDSTTGTSDLTVGTRALTLSGTRPYDGTATAAGSILKITNLVSGDDVTLSGTAALAGQDVGSQPISDFGSLALGGAQVDDYTLTGASGTVVITVVGSTVTVTPAARSVTYDGGQHGATATWASTGVDGEDGSLAVTYFGINGTSYDSTSAPTQAGEYEAEGIYAGDTNHTGSSNIAFFTITPLAVTIGGTRPYDGTATAAGSILTITNLVSGDDASLSGSATLAGQDAGSQSIIDFSGLALGGAQAADYTLAGASGSVTITPLTITASIVGDPTKPYDGTDAATLAPANFSLSGLLPGEGFTVTQTAGTYDSKDTDATTVSTTLGAGDFTPTGSTLAIDYTLPTSASGAGTITPLAVTLNGTRPYDGTATAAASILTITNVVDGDHVSLSGSATLASKNAGSQRITSFAGLTLGGAQAGDYTLSGARGNVVIASYNWIGGRGPSGDENDWSVPTNWDVRLDPNSVGMPVVFGNAGATGTVVLTSDRMVGTIVFNSYTPTTITSVAKRTLTLDNGTSDAAINVTGNVHNITLVSPNYS